MLIALVAYIASLIVLIAAGLSFYRNQRMTGLAICCILALQGFTRPLVLFLGLDIPSPEAWFATEEFTLMAKTSVALSIWVIVLTAVYWIADGATPTRGIFPRAPAHAKPSHVLIIVIVMTIFNVAVTGFLAWRMGGVAEFAVAVKSGKELAGAYVLREIGTVTVAMITYGIFAMWRIGQLEGQSLARAKAWMTFFFMLVLVNFAVNFAWGNRYNIAMMGLALAFGFHFNVRRFTFLSGSLLLSGSAIILLGLRTLRFAMKSEVTGLDVSSKFAAWREISVSLHLAQFDGLMLALRDAGKRFDFSYGAEFLNGLIAWVPRFIFPDKETYMVGGWFRRVYDSDKINGWPITVVGDWYVNFGWLGVLIGAALSGLFAAAVDAHYRKVTLSPWAAAIGGGIAFRVFDGGFDFGFVQRYVMLVVPLFAFAKVLEIAGRPRISGQGLPMPRTAASA